MPQAKPSAPRPSQAAARAPQPKPPRPFTKAEIEEFREKVQADPRVVEIYLGRAKVAHA